MKLSKVIKNTVFASMSVLVAAALSFTGCSNGSSDSGSSDVDVRTVSTFRGIPNYEYGKAETEANFEGYQSREKNLVNKNLLTSGAIIKTKITGKFATENYTPTSDAKMSFAFIDTSAAANYWADITSGCDIKISDCVDSDGNATFEFTNTVTGSVKGTQEDILFFLHSDDKSAYNASGKFIITNASYTIVKDGNIDNGSGDGNPTFTEKTSIKTSLQTGSNIWGSGASLVDSGNGYTGTAAGAGVGDWGGNLAVIITCFDAGTLNGYTHAVVDVDLSSYTLSDDNAEYPSIELKVGTEADTKMVNATSMYDATAKTLTIAFPSDADLSSADRIQITIRGSGTFTLTDISKAK